MYRDELRRLSDFKVFRGKPKAKMDQNESPSDVPRKIRDKIKESFREIPLNRYMRPETLSEVCEEIAGYCGTDIDKVAVGCGADAMIHTLIEIFAAGGGRVFYFEPSYPIYGLFATIAGAQKMPCMLDKQTFQIDEETAMEQVKECDIAFITYPNNPTGNLFRRDLIIRMIEENKKCHFVIDEAYYEYCGSTFAGLLDEYANLTVIRTFSKYFSIPSLRIGYALGSTETISLLRRCQFEPYNVSVYAAVAGTVILRNREQFQPAGKLVVGERKRIMTVLEGVEGLKTFHSDANFIFMFDEKKRDIAANLFEKKIYVRDYSQIPGFAGYFRVTVSSEKENNIFLNAVNEICSGRNG